MLTITLAGLDKEVLPGLQQLAQAGNISIADNGQAINAIKQTDGLKISCTSGKTTIAYGNLVQFFRGISYLIQGVDSVDESPAFANNGYMLDCSRNAVASIPAVKKLIRHMALMGLNTLQLYTEDTYEIPEWRYFGYQRGRYTAAELRELCQYAQMFGIELIPCIQTLAHLNAALRWPEFQDIIDCNDILLAGEEKTYRLIDDMLRQLSSCFATRRIHIGMDEAHMVGLGKYLDKHGYQNRIKIICDHLARVLDICKKYDFKPMMWSDMFFRLVSKGGYYEEGTFPPELLELLRPDVDLVYWDYYHKDKPHYLSMLTRHKKFPNDIIFAGGAWKWTGLMPELQLSEDTTRAALCACIEAGVTDVFATGWGDDGAECAAFSILPTLQLYAEMGYQSGTKKAAPPLPEGSGNGIHSRCSGGVWGSAPLDKCSLSARFEACTGGNWDDFFLLDKPNNTTPTRIGRANATKTLLYQDVMFGLFDKHVDPLTFSQHFAGCAAELTEAAGRNGDFGYIFLHAAAICRLLADKCTMGLRITAAYLEGNKEELRHLAEAELPKLQKLTDDAIYTFEHQWTTENKPHGLEIIHIRLGGVRIRLEAAARRISAYLSGEVERLEELESERLGFTGDIANGTDINVFCNRWQEIASASRMSW